MKRYFLFISSFILIGVLFQMLSGLTLTYFYTPDMSNAWETSGLLSQEIVLTGSNHTLQWITVLMAATLAYLVANKGTYQRCHFRSYFAPILIVILHYKLIRLESGGI